MRSIKALAAAAALGGALVVALPGPAHASSCDSWPVADIWARVGSPYSYNDGRIVVEMRQWRRTDRTFVHVRNAPPGTSVRLHRNDGRVCGPVTVDPGGFATVGTLNNRSHGVWACISYPSGGSCGAVKWEDSDGN